MEHSSHAHLRKVEQSCPCVACGYNLIGIPAEGRCPECGVLVSTLSDADFKRLRRTYAAIEVATLSATVVVSGLMLMAACAWAGWGFAFPFALGGVALGALGLILVEPIVLIAARGRWQDGLCVLPALFVAIVIGGRWDTRHEFMLTAMAATAVWGYGIAVQGAATAAARLVPASAVFCQTKRFMLFTRAALFTPVAACWMIYLVFNRPRDQGPWEVLEITVPVHRACALLVLFWLASVCVHWWIVLAKLKHFDTPRILPP